MSLQSHLSSLNPLCHLNHRKEAAHLIIEFCLRMSFWLLTLTNRQLKKTSRTDRLQTANLNFTLLINSERMNTTRSFILLSYQIFAFNTIMHPSFILQIKCGCSLYLTTCFKLLFACSELPIYLLKESGMRIFGVRNFQGPIPLKLRSSKACQIANL